MAHATRPPAAQCRFYFGGAGADQNFVAALLDAALVNAETIAQRLQIVPEPFRPGAERAREWLSARGAVR